MQKNHAIAEKHDRLSQGPLEGLPRSKKKIRFRTGTSRETSRPGEGAWGLAPRAARERCQTFWGCAVIDPLAVQHPGSLCSRLSHAPTAKKRFAELSGRHNGDRLTAERRDDPAHAFASGLQAHQGGKVVFAVGDFDQRADDVNDWAVL